MLAVTILEIPARRTLVDLVKKLAILTNALTLLKIEAKKFLLLLTFSGRIRITLRLSAFLAAFAVLVVLAFARTLAGKITMSTTFAFLLRRCLHLLQLR